MMTVNGAVVADAMPTVAGARGLAMWREESEEIAMLGRCAQSVESMDFSGIRRGSSLSLSITPRRRAKLKISICGLFVSAS